MTMATEMALPRFEMRPLSEEEGGGYLIEFPDYPGCVADGETPEEAMREGTDALNSYQATTLVARFHLAARFIAASGASASRNRFMRRLPPRRA
jgi:hypothetical protein